MSAALTGFDYTSAPAARPAMSEARFWQEVYLVNMGAPNVGHDDAVEVADDAVRALRDRLKVDVRELNLPPVEVDSDDV